MPLCGGERARTLTVLRQRIVTAVIAIGLVLLALWLLPTLVLAWLFAPLLLVGAWEWAGLAGYGRIASGVYVAAIGGSLFVAWTLLWNLAAFAVVLALSACWWGLAAVAVWRYPAGLLALAETGRAPAWIAVQRALEGLVIIAPAFYVLLRLHANARSGVAWILTLLLLIWSADSGAYFAGRAVGRHKLAPQVSPGKTWEGVAGGLFAALCLEAVVAHWGFGLGSGRLAAFLCIVVVVAAFSVVGDLTISVFKRRAGVKDSGSLFPGHGGLLDRLDSLFAAAPLFVLGLKLVGLP